MPSTTYTLSSFVTTILPATVGPYCLPPIAMAAKAGASRQLRKRKAVDYCESEDGLSLEPDDDMVPVKKRKTKSLPPQKVFPFLSLPPEIRNKVYGMVLGCNHEEEWLVAKLKNYRRIVQCATPEERRDNFQGLGHRYRRHRWAWTGTSGDGDEDVDDERHLPVSRAPHLLAVCRQIFEEAAPILYPETFVIEDTTALHHFLSAIGPCKRQFVKKIVIAGYGHSKSHKAYNHPALSLLKNLPCLEEVKFDCEITWGWRNDSMSRNARQLFRDGFRWFDTVEGAVEKVKLSKKVVENSSQGEDVFYKELRRLVGSG